MKKLLLAAILCGVFASGCKKEDKKFCFECTVSGDESSYEQCDLTEEEGKKLEEAFNAESDGETWKCAKK